MYYIPIAQLNRSKKSNGLVEQGGTITTNNEGSGTVSLYISNLTKIEINMTVIYNTTSSSSESVIVTKKNANNFTVQTWQGNRVCDWTAKGY